MCVDMMSVQDQVLTKERAQHLQTSMRLVLCSNDRSGQHEESTAFNFDFKKESKSDSEW